MNGSCNTILCLILLIILCFSLSPIVKCIEGLEGIYPGSVEKPILDTYPLSSRRGVGNGGNVNKNNNNPILSVSSYEQTTNNLRYTYNPDNGLCSPAEFCGALYDNIKTKSNEIYALPPVKEDNGARVGYFRSN